MESYQKGEISGWLIHPKLEFPEAIRSLSQFILMLDEVLAREENLVSRNAFEQTEIKKIPCIATLRINVLRQEHHSWQGHIWWEEQGKEEPFQSVLDLMQRIDEYLAD